MIIFYSGQQISCKRCDPEAVFKKKANIMLTYFDSYKAKDGLSKRMKNVFKMRKSLDSVLQR